MDAIVINKNKIINLIKRRIIFQILLPLLIVIFLFVVVIGFLLSNKLEKDYLETAANKAGSESANVSQGLFTINSLMSDEVKSSLKVFMNESEKIGAPSIKSSASLDNATVPEISFGKQKMVLNNDLVDKIKDLMGCTATIFVRSGDDFIRVSTNVIKDNKRATGTKLDPNGKAIKAIREGNSFYGVVDILGSPYLTGYEPIKENNNVIGIWYCGYPISALEQLGKQIAKVRILKNGFLALIDNKGNVSFHSDNITKDQIKNIIDNNGKENSNGWELKSSTFGEWNYKVIAATYREDINSEIINIKIVVLIFSVLFFIIVSALVYYIFRIKVEDRLKKLTVLSERIALGEVDLKVEASSGDEIGILEKSFSAMIENIRSQAYSAEQIAVGELNTEVKIKSEKDVLSRSLQKVVNTLKELIGQVLILTNAAVEGDLSARGDTGKFSGAYKQILNNMNTTFEAFAKPIGESNVVLNTIAKGDLTLRMAGDYKGDYAVIKNGINQFADSFSETIAEVHVAVQAAADAANQISISSEEMAAGAQEQSAQTTEVASAVEEMTKTILETTKNSSIAAETAKNAGMSAKEGGKVVAKTIEGMNRIAAVVKESAGTVQALGKSSDQIGEIVQVIDDIADQTNLLALNAAIEAARAGEQGRGFAVVADEVRKLAERTTKATKEIAAMIRQIQKDTGGAVESMSKGTEEVENGKALADKAGESLKEIIQGADKVVDVVTQVAAASEEQSSTSEEISRNIEGINNVTRESTAGIQHIAEASEELNRLTVNLQKLIAKFKIGDSLRGTQEKSLAKNSINNFAARPDKKAVRV